MEALKALLAYGQGVEEGAEGASLLAALDKSAGALGRAPESGDPDAL